MGLIQEVVLLYGMLGKKNEAGRGHWFGGSIHHQDRRISDLSVPPHPQKYTHDTSFRELLIRYGEPKSQTQKLPAMSSGNSAKYFASSCFSFLFCSMDMVRTPAPQSCWKNYIHLWT